MLSEEDLFYAFVLKWGRGDMVGGLHLQVRGCWSVQNLLAVESWCKLRRTLDFRSVLWGAN